MEIDCWRKARLCEMKKGEYSLIWRSVRASPRRLSHRLWRLAPLWKARVVVLNARKSPQ